MFEPHPARSHTVTAIPIVSRTMVHLHRAEAYRSAPKEMPEERVPGGHTFLTLSILHTSFGISSGEEDYTHGIVLGAVGRAHFPELIRRQGHRRPA